MRDEKRMYLRPDRLERLEEKTQDKSLLDFFCQIGSQARCRKEVAKFCRRHKQLVAEKPWHFRVYKKISFCVYV